MSKQLATNRSNITKIFRRLVQELQTDKEFSRVFGSNIRSWDGDATRQGSVLAQSEQADRPTHANPRNQVWQSPDSQRGDFFIRVEMAVSSLCIDDVTDAWDVLTLALSPFKLPLVRELVLAGAETGECLFSDPEFVTNPEMQTQGIFLANGAFQLAYIRMVNPARRDYD